MSAVGEFFVMLFLCAICVGFGVLISWAICLAREQMKRSKKIDQLLREKLSAKDYLKIQDYLEKYVDDYTPIVLFLQKKLSAVDFEIYLILAQIDNIERR